MIQLDDVCFAYDDRPILSHLTETIEPGQAVLLSGPNGSGKSTLLRLLNGLIFPQQGTYTFDGTVITAGKMRDHAYSKWFHQRLGYQLVGRFHQCGYKFGRWYDMIWMEKMLGAHRSPQPPVRPFPEIREAAEALLNR